MNRDLGSPLPLLAAVPPRAAPANGLPRGRNISGVKAHNMRAVLLALLQRGPIPRVDLARLTALSSTTITNLIAELLEQGVVTEVGRPVRPLERAPNRIRASERAGAGRPPTMLRLVPEARYAVGIHVGVDTLHAGVADLSGQLQSHLTIPHDTDATPEQILGSAADLAMQAVAEAGGDKRDGRLVGVGVGASGLTDPDAGVNILAPNLGWRDVPIREILARQLGCPVMVDNNVRAMALAESMFGAARDVNSLIFVYGRVGVGAGFVVGGEPYHGSQAGAGEIGHTTVIPAGGAPCRCGNTGCLETLVSEGHIVRQAQVLAARAPESLLASFLSDASEMPIDQVFAAARAGDREAYNLVAERAFYTGTALANLVNTVNPDMIILGGVFAAGADLMLPFIEETMRRRSFAGLGEKTALCVTAFGRKVGVIGAAALALDAFFYRQGANPG